MTWDLRTLQQSLSQNKINSAYTIMGDDTYLIQEAFEAIKNHFFAEGQGFDFNYDCCYASEAKAINIADIIETLPMMAEHRVVVVKEAHLLKDADWQVFEETFSKGLLKSVVVFVFESKVDKRKKFFKWLTSETTIVELKTPYDNQIPAWIHYMAGRQNLKLDQSAALQLLHLVGANLSELNNEIVKLKAYYADDEKVLFIDDILKVVSKKRIENVFDLTNAVGMGDKAQSLYFLEQLLEQGQNEVGVLSLLTRHMRILKKILEGQAQNLSQKQLSTKVGVSPYFIAEYLNQSKKWSLNKIEKVFDLLLDTDRALKSSPVSSKIWLENFIIQTCATMNSGILPEKTI